MRILLEGRISRTYVQTLCMMFFHGEKFPENEEGPRGELLVVARDSEEGIYCDAFLKYDGKESSGSSFVPFEAYDKYERTSKTAVGKAVYIAGHKLTGKIIPWGILTGIRPSKIASELLLEMDREQAIEVLQEKYLLAENKAGLAVSVAENETKIMSSFDESTCSMYISIPFCPTRCSYCSFISYPTTKLFELIPSYLDKLCLEIKQKLQLIKRLGLKLVTVYIGGGTPTTLSDSQLNILLRTISEGIDKKDLVEFTVEGGRPDTITKEKLAVLSAYGVDRISVNPQSLNDSVLMKIGRHHTVADFYSAYDLVKQSGIKLVNTDLIAGLDGDSYSSFKETVDEIIKLSPHNVTVHSFSVKKSAQILRDDGEIYNKGNDFATESVNYAYEALLANGYEPYYMYRQKNTVSDLENVGYSKGETHGIYNVLMMGDCHTVFGAGAGSTTKLVKKVDGKTVIKRIFSHKYPYEYLQDSQNNEKEISDFFS
ncbi:MAG: coproporphyrinogen dehydrogenase HemZ [Clostridia bacterium]|nr:coproporphyrinogen dehydrogenase HemZ [Clostridia bacterium]